MTSGQPFGPWTFGVNLEICAWVEERDEMAGRTRIGEGRGRWQERLNSAKEQLRGARRNIRIRLRELEREWWEEVIRECE